jgi:hypothetical protein
MTRDFEHLKLRAEQIALRRYLDKKIRRHRFNLQFVAKAAKKIRIGNHRRGLGMTTNRAAELPFNFRHVRDVIEMPVGEDEHFQIDGAATQPITAAIGRVEQDCSLRRVTEIAIRLEDSAAKALVFHLLFHAHDRNRKIDQDHTRDHEQEAKIEPAMNPSGYFEFSAVSIVLHRYCRLDFKEGLLLSNRQNATMQNLFFLE